VVLLVGVTVTGPRGPVGVSTELADVVSEMVVVIVSVMSMVDVKVEVVVPELVTVEPPRV